MGKNPHGCSSNEPLINCVAVDVVAVVAAVVVFVVVAEAVAVVDTMDKQEITAATVKMTADV